MNLNFLTVLGVAFLLLFSSTASKAQDTLPPVLYNVSIITDTAYNSGTVSVLLNANDDISGIDWVSQRVSISLRDPFGNTIQQYCNIHHWQHVQGNEYIGSGSVIGNYNGTYSGIISNVTLRDLAGNSVTYFRSQYPALFNNDTITFIGNYVDLVGPELLSATFDDTLYTFGDTIGLTIVARDTGSGVSSSILVDFVDHLGHDKELERIGFRYLNDTFFIEYLLPVWAMDGDWEIKQIQLIDNAGNRRYHTRTTNYIGGFQAFGMILDTTPPQLHSLTISPQYVHRGDSVFIELFASDSISGIDTALLSGNIILSIENAAGQQPIYSVDFRVGTLPNQFFGSFKLSDFAANGYWLINHIFIHDRAGNAGSWSQFNSTIPPSVTDTFYVIPDSLNIVRGTVLTSTGTPLENSRVYMVKVVPVDSTLISFRTAYTNTDGQYEFISEARDSVIYIKAIPNDTFYVDELPTYLDSAWLFADARVLQIDSFITVVDTFNTLLGTNPGGHGFVQGHIYSGAGKQSTTPVAGQALVLVAANNVPVAFATTDVDGGYSFGNLPNGTYRLFADWPGIDNSKAPTLHITADEFSLTAYDYQVVGTALKKIEVGIPNVVVDGTITVFPNPMKGKFELTLSSNTHADLVFTLTDINGKQISNLISQTLGNNQWKLSVGTLPAGSYFLGVSSANEHWQIPVMLLE